MISPYRNRLPMAYLPATRAVDTVGMDPMFYGRVSGVGTVEMRGVLESIIRAAPIGPPPEGTIFFDPKPRLQVCPPVCPEGYVPPSQRLPTIPMVEPGKPTASALPLLIGAAFLLLA